MSNLQNNNLLITFYKPIEHNITNLLFKQIYDYTQMYKEYTEKGMEHYHILATGLKKPMSMVWIRHWFVKTYKTLIDTKKDKQYFNNYLLNAAQQNTDVNQASKDYKAAMFTTSELNYNATPTESIKNLFTTNTGKINWVLYGAIAIGAILLIKNIRK